MQFDLVFEGGGAKGAVFIGALEEFEARGHTPARIVGTSAGAITATLLAAGYSARAARERLEARDARGRPMMSGFLDIPTSFTQADIDNSFLGAMVRFDIPLLPDRIEQQLDQFIVERLLRSAKFRQLFSFVELGGVYEGRAFIDWMRAALDARVAGLGNATFEKFARLTGSDLSVVASDTDAQQLLVLNHRTAPDLPVAWAVRMSMSIPFVWQEVVWRREWGKFRGRDLTGHAIVDGGVLSNFPMHLLTTAMSEVVEIMGEADPLAIPNLGFLIDEELEVPDSATTMHMSTAPKPFRRVTRLIDTMLNARDREIIERCMQDDEVCRLPAGGYGTAEFDMSPKRFEALVEAGRCAAREYFDRRERTGA
jgi:predicted acylesterase/phospholipase RssA